MTFILLSNKVYHIIRWILGLLFLLSGAIKLMDLDSFSRVIDAFGILPWELIELAALLISITEVLAGAGLLADIKGSLGTLLLLLLMFAAVLGYAIHMGYNIDCGCFGENDPVAKIFASLYASLIRDMMLVIVVIYLYIWRNWNNMNPLSLIAHMGKLQKRRI